MWLICSGLEIFFNVCPTDLGVSIVTGYFSCIHLFFSGVTIKVWRYKYREYAKVANPSNTTNM